MAYLEATRCRIKPKIAKIVAHKDGCLDSFQRLGANGNCLSELAVPESFLTTSEHMAWGLHTAPYSQFANSRRTVIMKTDSAEKSACSVCADLTLFSSSLAVASRTNEYKAGLKNVAFQEVLSM